MHHDQIVALRRRSGMSVLIEQAAHQITPPTHCASIRRDLMSPRISRSVGDMRGARLPSRHQLCHPQQVVCRSRLYAAPATIASISILDRPTNLALACPATVFVHPITCSTRFRTRWLSS